MPMNGCSHLVNFILTITLRIAILQGKPSALGIPFIYCLPGCICLAGYKGKILYNNRAHQFPAHHYFPAESDGRNFLWLNRPVLRGLAQMQDTWSFHAESIKEYDLLYTSPAEYFTNLFQDPYGAGFGGFFAGTDSYWNDLKSNILIKLFSVFNIFSFGTYYVNVIFYSFITLFGAIAIFKVMNDAFPGKRMNILLATFLVPSFLYWTSGLHKEGLIFTGISLIIYSIYFGSIEKKWGFKRVSSLLTGLLLLPVLRNFIRVIIIPAIIAWLAATR